MIGRLQSIQWLVLESPEETRDMSNCVGMTSSSPKSSLTLWSEVSNLRQTFPVWFLTVKWMNHGDMAYELEKCSLYRNNDLSFDPFAHMLSWEGAERGILGVCPQLVFMNHWTVVTRRDPLSKMQNNRSHLMLTYGLCRYTHVHTHAHTHMHKLEIMKKYDSVYVVYTYSFVEGMLRKVRNTYD